MELSQLVSGCLSVCGAAGQLQELSVSGSTQLASAAWLSGLTRLHTLQLFTSGTVVLPPEVTRLRELTSLFFGGAGMCELEEGGQLPGGLVSLRLEGNGHLPLLPQVSALSALSALMLISLPDCQPDSLAPLSGLTALRHLMLTGVKPLPSSLSTLTRLEQLLVTSCPGHTAMTAALAELQLLTTLYVGANQYNQTEVDEILPRIPPTIAALPRLQRLFIERSPGMPDPSLPSAGGPWLQSIRWLGLPWDVLQAGAGVLSAAPRLQYIYSIGTPHTDAHVGHPGCLKWCAFWEFVATHAPLRCLGYFTTDQDYEDGKGHEHLADAAFMLNNRRPGLRLRRLKTDDTFFDEMLDCADIPPGPGDHHGLAALDLHVQAAQARRHQGK